MPESSRGGRSVALFGTEAIDQAICGIGAGCVSVLCMHPLDLLKVKFQVSSNPLDRRRIYSTILNRNRNLNNDHNKNYKVPTKIEKNRIIESLKKIVKEDGFKGLYRGLGPNMIGNATSWGFYFLWYSIIKERMSKNPDGSREKLKLNAPQHLFASASAGVISAMLTNPFWVVKTRMFTTRSSSAGSYKNVFDGLYRISKEEGPRGLWRGSILALVGVSNGAIQFMTYEELKKWRKDRAHRGLQKPDSTNSSLTESQISLSNSEYVVLSGASKLLAIGITYPYQVVRSRIQNQLFILEPSKELINRSNSAGFHYRSIPHCISHTYQTEGLKAFYRGLGTNAIRVLPGTCVTFVVYENLSRWIREAAERKSYGY